MTAFGPAEVRRQYPREPDPAAHRYTCKVGHGTREPHGRGADDPADIMRKHPVNSVVIYHRVGVLNVEDINLVVAIGAAHRSEGFAASQYAIDQFKEKLPTGKIETYVDGSTWTGD